MKGDRVQEALLLFIAAGWSEKKVLELFGEVRGREMSNISRDVRLLKRRLSPTRQPRRPSKAASNDALDRSLRMLRSIGPYSENEIARLLMRAAEKDSLSPLEISKGGLRPWLVSLMAQVGPERLLQFVTSFRDDLVNNPRPGWTTKDVK